MSTVLESTPQQEPTDGAAAVTQIPGQTEPTRFSDEEISDRTRAGETTSEPSLLPPGVDGAEAARAAAEGVTATWHSGVITAMWSINETRNAFVYLQGVGWRKIFNGRDGAFMALVALAGQARQTGRTVSLREEADTMIYEIYLW